MLVSFTFEIESKIKDKIEEIATKEDRSMAAQLRVILDDYFENKK
jgi:predicted transcriptional regulator